MFFGDYFARPSKQGGAWMGTLRDQQKLSGNVRPIVVNVMNFNKGEPTLLSFEDARTLFHEMGHGLHGLLSNVTYPTVSCTSVLTDLVELPSQLYEHWFEQPEVLKKFARHHRTGEPIPDALVDKLMAAKNFDRGCQTLEYISSALVDLDLHLLQSADGLDVNAFEKKALDSLGMPEEIVMRHRPPHHGHVFSGGYYASAYYSYMWSEVLDADAFCGLRGDRRHLQSRGGEEAAASTCCRPAARAIRPSSTSRSAAGCRPRTRCSRSGASSTPHETTRCASRCGAAALGVLARFFAVRTAEAGSCSRQYWPAGKAAIAGDNVHPAVFEGPIIAFRARARPTLYTPHHDRFKTAWAGAATSWQLSCSQGQQTLNSSWPPLRRALVQQHRGREFMLRQALSGQRRDYPGQAGMQSSGLDVLCARPRRDSLGK